MAHRNILILDFDFFSTLGGGQVLYRRIVERNPEMVFFYPSNGPDLKPEIRDRLPPNARPFPYDRNLDVATINPAFASEHWLDQHFANEIARVLSPLQGMVFDAVDIPSFRPQAYILRAVASCFGIVIHRIALGLVGWGSRSLEQAYEQDSSDRAAFQSYIQRLMFAESQSIVAADVRYTISRIEEAFDFGNKLPIVMLDMCDTIESFPTVLPFPPGTGAPDLWYVGRLDGAKGPDLFIELAARLPRHLFGHCFFAGPDNDWQPQARWSKHLEQIAAARGLDATYVGTPSDAEIRSRVYAGRSVLVVPSRIDAFNYVALEAVLNGCPVLLSERTGASEFLRDHRPDLLPPILNPDDLEGGAKKLRQMLERYQEIAERNRQALRTRPFPAPRPMFMEEVYGTQPKSSHEWRAETTALTRAIRQTRPLCGLGVAAWRPARQATRPLRISLILAAPQDLGLLPPLLANLAAQTIPDLEILVADGTQGRFPELQEMVAVFAPSAVAIRVPNGTDGETINRTLARASGSYVSILDAATRLAPDWLALAIATLEAAPEAVGAYCDWEFLDEAGHRLTPAPIGDHDRASMLAQHLCLPGPGAILRRTALVAAGARDPYFRFLASFDMWLRVSGLGPVMHVGSHPRIWQLVHDLSPASTEARRDIAAEHTALIERFFKSPMERNRHRSTMTSAFLAARRAASAVVDPENPLPLEAAPWMHHWPLNRQSGTNDQDEQAWR